MKTNRNQRDIHSEITYALMGLCILAEAVISYHGGAGAMSRIISVGFAPLLFVLFGRSYRLGYGQESQVKVFLWRLLAPALLMIAAQNLFRIFSYDEQSYKNIEPWMLDTLRSVFWMQGISSDLSNGIGFVWILVSLFTILCLFRSINSRVVRWIISVAAFVGSVGLSMAGIAAPLALGYTARYMLLFAIGECPVWDQLLGAFESLGSEQESISDESDISSANGVYGIFGILLGVFASVGSSFAIFLSLRSVDYLFTTYGQHRNPVTNILVRLLVLWIVGLVIDYVSKTLRSEQYKSVTGLDLIGRFYDRYRMIFSVIFFIGFACAYNYRSFHTTMFYMLISDWTWANILQDVYEAILLVSVLASICGMCSAAQEKIRAGELTQQTSIFKNRALRRIFGCMVLLMAAYVFVYFGGEYEIYIMALIVIGMSGKSAKALLWIGLVSSIFWCIAAYAASMNGYIAWLVYPEADGALSHAMGLVYRTDCAAHYFYIFMIIRALKQKRFSLTAYVLWGYAIYYTYHLTDAQNTFLCSVLFMILLFTLEYIRPAIGKYNIKRRGKAFPDGFHKLLKFVMTYAFWIGAVGSFAMTILYHALEGKVTFPLEAKLSTLYARFRLGFQGFTEYPLRLLGQWVYEAGAGGIQDGSNEYFFLDCGYVRVLIVYGILMFAALMIYETICIKRSLKHHNIYMLAILLIIALHTVVEHHISEYWYNIFILLPLANWDLPSNQSGMISLDDQNEAKNR